MATAWVWVDFENTPHVLFLEPIITHLRSRGWEVRITAKPQSQTVELAGARSLAVTPIGAGDLAGRVRKIVGGVGRAAALAGWIGWRNKPRVLVCSSRTAALSAYVLGIPVVGLLDYEHAEHRMLAMAGRSLWLPDLLRDTPLIRAARRVARFYPGLKENLYLDRWVFDRAHERRSLGIGEHERLVVARPPATTAHYASGDGYRLWQVAVESLGTRSGVRVVVMPRTDRQRRELEIQLRRLPRVEFLPAVVPGPGPVAAADLVLGGGGTMNREAAVLGVPVWSVFTGPPPRIDEALAEEGRLRWVRSSDRLTEALRDELPSRLPPRGPFASGLAAILADIRMTLDQARSGAA